MEGIIGGFILGMLTAVVIMSTTTTKSDVLKKEAIEKGFAEYNQTTGKWQWKEATEGAQGNDDTH